MSGEEERAAPASVRRRQTGLVLACLLAAALVVGGVVAVRALGATGSPGSAPRASSSTPSATSATTTSAPRSRSATARSTAPRTRGSAQALRALRTSRHLTARQRTAGRAATAVVGAFLHAGSVSLRRPGATAPDVDQLATGAARSEVEALATQYHDMGYRVVGSPRVTSVALRSVDLDAHPPRAVLAVCLDNSRVDVLDQKGRSQAERMYSTRRPVLNVYGLQLSGSTWQVATHSIPSRSSCSTRTSTRNTQ